MNNEFDIAIIGMAGRFPGARNLDEFWQNLAGGVESIARFSDKEILESGAPASWLHKPNYVKAAPVLDEPGHFDAGFFGFSPMEARTMDPQHRLLLELAHESIESAGYDPERYPGRIGMFAGSAMNTYFMNVGLSSRFAEEYIPTLIGNDKDFLSTRISYKLNLKGPSVTVQTACSTSLVAVHLACQSLLSEESDAALAGAVSVRVPHRAGYFCDGGGVVSPDGHVRAFDAGANGTVFGSGGGILVLKRLADALKDGDTVHAVIKGSAVNNDGSEKAGYTAPSVNSQADAVVEALANGGVEADSISYIEAHGSGTPVGDPIEVRALTKAFRTSTQRSGYCAIGSVKTNVGHLDAAAAVAGIIKTVLALKHRQIPPSLHFTEANPEIDFARTPFYVNSKLREWTSDGPRRAGVMSTGMGGTNAHVVLEEAPQPLKPTHPPTDRSADFQVCCVAGFQTRTPHDAARSADLEIGDTADLETCATSVTRVESIPHLLVLSAKTETALDHATQRLREFLLHNESVNLSDVAYTLQVGRKAFAHRLCLACADGQDAIAALGEENSKRVLSGRMDSDDSARRPVILLVPGIGDHYVGMAHDLYETRPVFREEVDRCARILEAHMDVDIRSIIYPEGQSWKKRSKPKGIDLKQMLGRKTDAPENADSRKLNQTLFAQPALFTIEYAMARLWQSLGVTPYAIVGHSMGEYVAACLAGVLSLEDALRLIATRARLVNELPQGAMLAVTLPEDELLPLLPEGLSISLINGPRLCVVAGPVEAVGEFEKTLNEKSIICRRVQNAHAFHSRMLDPIVKLFEAEVRKIQLNEPSIPFISNVTGKWITREQATDPAYWALHANHTARFSDALHELWKSGDPILLEAGPGRTLGVLAMQHPDRLAQHNPGGGRNGGDALVVSSIRHDYENQSDVEFLWHAIARLWLAGVEIKWEEIYRGEPRRRVPLPTYPFERQRYWLEPVHVPDAATQKQAALQKHPDTSQWLYAPSWKRLLPKSVGIHETVLPTEKTGPWLVFADDCGLASALIARLEAAGNDVVTVKAGNSFHQVDSHTFTIRPGEFQHYDSLIRTLQANGSLPDHLVHAWCATGTFAGSVAQVSEPAVSPISKSASAGKSQHSEAANARRLETCDTADLEVCATSQPDRDCFTQAQALGFYSLLFLARSLAAHDVGHKTKLFVVSNGVHEVCGTEALCPEKSTLLGPCMVIGQEYPNIRVKSIDVDALERGHEKQRQAAADLVMGELMDADSNLFVAHRNGQRWVQSYEPVDPSPRLSPHLMERGRKGEETHSPTFRERGVYLITGGLGGIGMAISEYLAIKYQARLVLVGRSTMPERESWADWTRSHPSDDPISAKIRALDRIEKLGGEILCVSATVADADAVRHVIEQTQQRFGALHGVIHGAGIVGNAAYQEIKDSDPGSCEGHFQAKAHGVHVLAEVLEGKKLDFCLLMSSLTSVLGGIGQAAYASSNLYLDAFARRHNRTSRVPWLSVNWDVWRLQDQSAKGAAPGGTLKELGMSAAEAMEMMETALVMKSAGQLVVSTGDLEARIKQWIKLESLHDAATRPASSRRRGPQTNGDPPRDEIEQQIAQVWQDALGMDAVGIHESFSQLGGHSLLAIRIVSELRNSFQIDLSVRALFDAPTVADLSKYVRERLVADIDALSDEEARQLVSNG